MGHGKRGIPVISINACSKVKDGGTRLTRKVLKLEQCAPAFDYSLAEKYENLQIAYQILDCTTWEELG